MSIVKEIANSTKVAQHPIYNNTPFKDFVELSSNTKGKLIEAMVNEILTQEGHEVFDNENVQHDLKVRFKGENHKTKLEIKGSLYNRRGVMNVGAFNLAHDFDEVFVVLVYPEEVRGYRVNRSILRGMEKNSVLTPSKQGVMIGRITSDLLESYDCTRVF